MQQSNVSLQGQKNLSILFEMSIFICTTTLKFISINVISV